MLKPISYIHYNESAALDFSLRAVPERVGSLTDYPSRTATDVERPIAGFKSAPVMPVASQCKHLLFVSLIVFLVACQKPETEKLKKTASPSEPAAKATANDSAGMPRVSYAEVVDNPHQ